MIRECTSIVAVLLLSAPVAARGSERLIERLESVKGSKLHAYRLRDDKGNSMDCLKPFPNPAGGYLGLYHSLKQKVFRVRLASSQDLVKWTHIVSLDEHGSQPTIHLCADGSCLMAYEKDAPNSCWIRLRRYASVSALLKGEFSREFDIERTLAPTAEGTPSFESVKMPGGRLDQSEIRLRFHYFKEAKVDRLARGTLTGFRSWKCEASDRLNAAFEKDGARGNFGDRDKFTFNGKAYYLQEIQFKRGAWDSWRVYLCDASGMPMKKLSFQTHSGSTSFANPSATWIRDPKGGDRLAITLFMPSQGNAADEAGELLYVVDPQELR